ncbi:3-methyl-2-oxobutanoate hydroxymethyltransferase [Streptomyces malaysiensis]|uniref:3-methyl-2-oxobutanoate hydroxymethyltransferase n=1 Tax=Streptomyces malaysiensis TaxID=92644 RepID=UPI004048AEF0
MVGAQSRRYAAGGGGGRTAPARTRDVRHRPGRAVVIADLPSGSYETSAEHCSQTAVRFMKEAGAHAVKLEASEERLP